MAAQKFLSMFMPTKRKQAKHWRELLTMLALLIGIALPVSFVHAARTEPACKCPFCEEVKLESGRAKIPYAPTIVTGSIIVSDSQELISALLSAGDGQTIVLEDGEYQVGWIKVSSSVRIVGRTLWGAVLKPGSLLEIVGKGVRIEGLRFEEGGHVSTKNSRDHSIYVEADGVTIINNQFYNSGINSTIADKTGIAIEILGAQNVIIERNEFSNSHGVAIKTDDFTRDITIRHNNFIDSPKYGGVGEVVHLGNAETNLKEKSPFQEDVRAIFEYNYINGWDLESELMSIKSDFNIIQNNYIENSGESAIVVRMGNFNKIRRNVMIKNKVYPIRISGKSNVFEGNYFEGEGSMIFLHNKVFYRIFEKNLKLAYLPAENNTISKNFFVGYDHIFGFRDQEHVVRDAPKNNIFVDIPASRQNPKKLRVDDAEVICDGIAELVPFSGHGLS